MVSPSLPSASALCGKTLAPTRSSSCARRSRAGGVPAPAAHGAAVIDGKARGVADHVVGHVIDLAEHLVGRVEIVMRVQDAVERHIDAVAGCVVAIVVDRVQILHGVGQPLRLIVGVGDEPRG